MNPSGKLVFLKKLTLSSSSNENIVAETVRKLINVNNSKDSSLQTGRTQKLLEDDDTLPMTTKTKESSISQGKKNKSESIMQNPRTLPQTGQRQFKEDNELDDTILLQDSERGYWCI
ncbi:Hypothetical predicted protein [Mytilus galloprovincialis]|uniref:Uncharacterized protein n=1 Tax=Mytilus galloprovincialis TaxID=29158 RepID=A0A8B6DG67_MYTGA|nr:Hypothetical predicted protein [Mytilus galloprovincialis]